MAEQNQFNPKPRTEAPEKRKKEIKGSLEIPEGIKVSVVQGIVKVEGSKGAMVEKNLFHPCIDIKLEGNTLLFNPLKKPTKRELKLLKTFIAHIKNMFKGVTEGHNYKLKICSSHFPMNVNVSGNQLVIKNFIGEKHPRTLQIPDGVAVKIEGDLINVDGIDKEKTSQTAASIERLTRRQNFDKRIFQDGIYIIEKDGKSIGR